MGMKYVAAHIIFILCSEGCLKSVFFLVSGIVLTCNPQDYSG